MARLDVVKVPIAAAIAKWFDGIPFIVFPGIFPPVGHVRTSAFQICLGFGSAVRKSPKSKINDDKWLDPSPPFQRYHCWQMRNSPPGTVDGSEIRLTT